MLNSYFIFTISVTLRKKKEINKQEVSHNVLKLHIAYVGPDELDLYESYSIRLSLSVEQINGQRWKLSPLRGRGGSSIHPNIAKFRVNIIVDTVTELNCTRCWTNVRLPSSQDSVASVIKSISGQCWMKLILRRL